ncbi:hypothetical protein [Bacillus sp. SG-1]|uniref:hypothetical protein n=1 Tax=Bacillus sp. SG-1 TaxID=161544 RepID=UPI0005C6B311|nr:hypothetical protein [Bacillus sp. SG-1]
MSGGEIAPFIAVTFFLYFICLFLYLRYGRKAFFISTVGTAVMVIPELFLLMEFKSFYDQHKNIYPDINTFMNIPIALVIITLGINVVNGIVITLREIKKKKVVSA